MLQRAEQVAHETEPWATDSLNFAGWKSNEAVLNRLVSETGGKQLSFVVHTSDEYGVGVLATVEVVLAGSAPSSWFGAEYVDYNICVRFVIRREVSGPREITPEAFECPPEVPVTPSPR